MEAFADEPSSWNSALDVVLDWCDAIRSRDLARATSLCHADVVLEWPRGVGRGVQLLSAWLGTGAVLPPSRAFQRGKVVVVEQPAARDLDDPTSKSGAPAALAFEIDASRLCRVTRHRLLSEAFAEHGFSESDEVAVIASHPVGLSRSA